MKTPQGFTEAHTKSHREYRLRLQKQLRPPAEQEEDTLDGVLLQHDGVERPTARVDVENNVGFPTLNGRNTHFMAHAKKALNVNDYIRIPFTPLIIFHKSEYQGN